MKRLVGRSIIRDVGRMVLLQKKVPERIKEGEVKRSLPSEPNRKIRETKNHRKGKWVPKKS